MSHTTVINNIEVTDVNALRQAVQELKSKGVDCSLIENAIPRAFYANQAGMSDKADIVVKDNSGPYDIGFYRRGDGKGYEMRMDTYGGSIGKSFGTSESPVGKLMQLYGVHAATRKAVQQGYSVRRKELDDGTIKLFVEV
jgi:hypothetical protein